MSEGGNLPHWLVDGALGSWIAVTGWVSRRFVKQVDEHETRLGTLERVSITRDSFENYVKQLRDERFNMHKENKDSIKELRDSIDGLRDNILSLARGPR